MLFKMDVCSLQVSKTSNKLCIRSSCLGSIMVLKSHAFFFTRKGTRVTEDDLVSRDVNVLRIAQFHCLRVKESIQPRGIRITFYYLFLEKSVALIS